MFGYLVRLDYLNLKEFIFSYDHWLGYSLKKGKLDQKNWKKKRPHQDLNPGRQIQSLSANHYTMEPLSPREFLALAIPIAELFRRTWIHRLAWWRVPILARKKEWRSCDEDPCWFRQHFSELVREERAGNTHWGRRFRNLFAPIRPQSWRTFVAADVTTSPQRRLPLHPNFWTESSYRQSPP